jgi:hypothetical protein
MLPHDLLVTADPCGTLPHDLLVTADPCGTLPHLLERSATSDSLSIRL